LAIQDRFHIYIYIYIYIIIYIYIYIYTYITGALFYAPAKRDVYIKLPKEDEEEGLCGRLLKSTHGTGDASMNWEEEYVRFMLSAGFIRGQSRPCLFYHPGKDIRAVVHGDDFKTQIERIYAIDFKAKLGPQEGDTKVVRLLNRVIEWKHDGIYMESDPRHAEIIVKQLELENALPFSAGPRRKWRSAKNLTGEDVEELNGQDAEGIICPLIGVTSDTQLKN